MLRDSGGVCSQLRFRSSAAGCHDGLDAWRAWRMPEVTPLPVRGSGIEAASPTMNQLSPHTFVVTYG